MPRIGITAYDLVVSCPGDVTDYLDIIKDSLDNFNRIFGSINNIEVVTKHWSTDSYPQSGDKPQELLNKQFVRACDAAIAIFWTRFGTPTDKYGSGTEEEIEEMLSAGKQVFMYFLDAPISPSKVDMGQYKKVEDFKEKYKDRGIYFVIKDKQEFQRLFTNHIGLHFLPLITGEVQKREDYKPNLHIRDAKNSKESIFSASNRSLCNTEFIHKKHTAIIESFGTLLSTKLPSRTMKENYIVDTSMNFGLQKLIATQSVLSKTEGNAEIAEHIKDVIDLFVKENKKIIGGDFWNVGDLKKYQPLFIGPFGGGPTFEGTDDEKNRYDALIKLYWDIVEYNEYITYFTSIDVKKAVRLVLNNSGNTFDEDIGIKMIIPVGFICHAVDFSYPGENIIKDINKMDFLKLFKIEGNENIQPYGYYPVEAPDFSDAILKANPFNSLGDVEKYEKEKRKYDTAFENIFYYKPFDGADNDIWTFHIDYLKHHTAMAFPSVLLFNKVPPYIEYEIRSKHLPEIVKGKLEFQEDH